MEAADLEGDPDYFPDLLEDYEESVQILVSLAEEADEKNMSLEGISSSVKAKTMSGMLSLLQSHL